MIFYLGTHRPNWLGQVNVPLCVSRRVLADRKTFPQAQAPWMLDSGGFTEISMYGRWRTDPHTYAGQVDHITKEIGNCTAVAPQDWMCEPPMLSKTGLPIVEHQRATCTSVEYLRYAVGPIVFPVLQGWERDDYLRHWHMYEAWGIHLEDEPLVGVGSVCRRHSDKQIGDIIHALQPLKLHAFGVRGDSLKNLAPFLASADSMAWSYDGRMRRRMTCTHKAKNCANCLTHALLWREERLIDIEHQQRLEVPCVA